MAGHGASRSGLQGATGKVEAVAMVTMAVVVVEVVKAGARRRRVGAVGLGVDRLPWGQIRVYPVAERDEANFG